MSLGTGRRCPPHYHTCSIPRPCSYPWLALGLGGFGILYLGQSCGCRANRQQQPAPAWEQGLPGFHPLTGPQSPGNWGLGRSETHLWLCQSTWLGGAFVTGKPVWMSRNPSPQRSPNPLPHPAPWCLISRSLGCALEASAEVTYLQEPMHSARPERLREDAALVCVPSRGTWGRQLGSDCTV